jgi:hypothetical protein
MFFAGILNIMTIALILLVGLGLFLLIHSNPIKNHPSAYDIFIFALFSGICLIFAIRVKGILMTHYDCFSHWLTVVKELLGKNALPNFESEIITFSSYPTGTAGFIYYFCKVLGRSTDSLVLLGQDILLAASILPFAAFVKKKSLGGIIVAFCAMFYSIISNTFTDTPAAEMLVDTLVSTLSVSSLAIIIYYREDLFRAAFLSLPLQVFLIAVKNSGMIMVALNVCVLVFLSILQDVRKKEKFHFARFFKLGCIGGGIPLASLILWNKHVEYVFVSGNTSKHSVSAENYAAILGEKSPEQIKEIISVFLKRLLSPNVAMLVLALIFAGLIFGYLARRCFLKKRGLNELYIGVGVLGAYLFFMAILGVMYLVSMPYNESIVLASYERYEKTVLIYLVGGFIIYLLWLISEFSENTKKLLVALVCAAISVVILFSEWANIQIFFNKTYHYEGSQRQKIENIIAEYNLPQNESYFLYGDSVNGDGAYTYFLGMYLFNDHMINACGSQELEKCKPYMQDYHYLVILERDELIDALLIERGFTPGQTVYHWSK